VGSRRGREPDLGSQWGEVRPRCMTNGDEEKR
jgi:hypothetical protein